jgi:valyl-tRNA synthetase
MAETKKKSRFDPHQAEEKWMKFWEEEGIYKFDEKGDKELYVVDTPPPTVSGKMHIGHSFSYTQQDIIVRFQRMIGKSVFYPFGTDDNGLATDRLVERINNVKSSKMKRKEYVKLCLETLKKIRPDFVYDWKRLGISCDFGIFYSTINDHCQRISQRSFLDLLKAGREYRMESPTMWCPKCETAIAQVELDDKDLSSTFNDIIFKVDGMKDLIIATTRPELLPSCGAVFVHPDDKRWKDYVGKKAKVPLFDYEVPILTDHRADPEKGTGVVMCCTFGDQTDIEWFKAHKLPMRISITKDGKMTELAGKYRGMGLLEARKAIISELKTAGLLVSQKPIQHTVNVHERCGTEVEILHSKQWYIRYLDLKDKFLEFGIKLRWYPQFMINRLENWIKGLQWDWCISRQRHFGIPIPVWYCKKCDEVIPAKEENLPVDPLDDKPPVDKCPKCRGTKFVGEKDVLDTWATSSLTPKLAAELYKGKPIFKKLYPMTLRPQAHDIISFWLFNTMVKSILHNSVNPWRDVVISGWALDPHGKKMSKSKGNIVDPRKMWEKYSVDALRFWASGSKLGDDMPFQEKDLVTGQKTVTKLWNASRFALIHLEGYKPKAIKLMSIDRWLLSKLYRLIQFSTKSFEKYEYSKVKAAVENFFWNTFCDNYLEMIKDRLYLPEKYEKGAKESAQFTLYQSLLTILKLFAPIMPYITEEIYHLYFDKIENKKSIHISSWPEFKAELINDDIEKMGDLAVLIIGGVRKFKSELLSVLMRTRGKLKK